MERKMEDRRNIKTEELIKDIFLNLLKEKSLNKITVAEISRLANIGRGTFYLHYSDVYDLYECIERDAISKMKKIFKEAFPTTNSENSMKLAISLTEYIEENKDLFRILVRSDSSNTMYKIKKSFYSEVFDENTLINPTMNDEYNQIESIFVVSGIVGVLERWIIEGFKIPSSSVAKMLNNVILKINKSEQKSEQKTSL